MLAEIPICLMQLMWISQPLSQLNRLISADLHANVVPLKHAPMHRHCIWASPLRCGARSQTMMMHSCCRCHPSLAWLRAMHRWQRAISRQAWVSPAPPDFLFLLDTCRAAILARIRAARELACITITPDGLPATNRVRCWNCLVTLGNQPVYYI